MIRVSYSCTHIYFHTTLVVLFGFPYLVGGHHQVPVQLDGVMQLHQLIGGRVDEAFYVQDEHAVEASQGRSMFISVFCMFVSMFCHIIVMSLTLAGSRMPCSGQMCFLHTHICTPTLTPADERQQAACYRNHTHTSTNCLGVCSISDVIE